MSYLTRYKYALKSLVDWVSDFPHWRQALPSVSFADLKPAEFRKHAHLFNLVKKIVSDKGFRRLVRYNEFVTTLPIEERAVMYENFHGDSVGDNPAALFREICSREQFLGFRHVWAIKRGVQCPLWVSNSPGVEVVEINSLQYRRYLATCKYLINNTTFPPYFTRRSEQLYINTWHGTPLKTLGRDQQGVLGRHKNIQRNFAHTTHLVSPNRYTSQKILESHDLDALYPGEVLELGYPRIDTTLNTDNSALRERLMPGDSRKLVLYAPTWRGEIGNIDLDVERLINDVRVLSERLKDGCRVALRVHPLAKRHVTNAGLGEYLVSADVETNALLSVVDILVTDYSSILFDFLVTGRPVVYYTFDIQEYMDVRGLYLEMKELPGLQCSTIGDVADGVENAGRWWPRESERLATARRLYCKADDGDASRRIIDIVFNGVSDNRVYRISDSRTKILIYAGGWLHNGITTSAINLLRSIDHEKYQIVVIGKGSCDHVSAGNLRRVPAQVKHFYRVGQVNASLAELFEQNVAFRDPASRMDSLPRSMYQREFRRLFGDIEFDVVIDFSGYVKFWTLVMLAGNVPHRIIYQHNQMLAESDKIIGGKLKHRKNLALIFRLYKEFDKIACVSVETMQKNREDLASFADPTNYRAVPNALDERYIEINTEPEVLLEGRQNLLERGERRADTAGATPRPLPSADAFTFLAVGRLSPEKDHAKLLRAFSALVAEYPQARLVIAGDGVLLQMLLRLRDELSLQSAVTFLGQIQEPLSLMRRCDCLVQSSNHEGQPMVLLEALATGIPTIATDIPGNRSVLNGTEGRLVSNSAEGLVKGMRQACEGNIRKPEFDTRAYNENALQQFYNLVGTGEHVPCGSVVGRPKFA